MRSHWFAQLISKYGNALKATEEKVKELKSQHKKQWSFLCEDDDDEDENVMQPFIFIGKPINLFPSSFSLICCIN